MIRYFTIITAALQFIISNNFLFSQWVELNSGVNVRLNSISSIKELTTWACGNNGTVIKSSNMGDNWENGNLGGIPSNINLHHIYALNEMKVFAAGNDGITANLYLTNDAGASWSVNKTQINGKFNAIYFIDNNTGILIGSPVNGRWSIWKTINGGFSWDSTGKYLQQNMTEIGFPNSLWAAGSTIWIGTDNYRVYKSTNFGTNWMAQPTGSEINSAPLWFDFDYNIGLTGSSNLLRTVNSGNNWIVETIPGTGSIVSVTGSAHSRFNWVIRSDNKIYLNPHNTNTWEYDYTAPNGNYTYMSIERNGYFGGAVFALRDNGGISRTYFLAIGINIISTGVPVKTILNQNYPNPFNPNTSITFDISEKNFTTIEIFNSAGQTIDRPVNSELQPGSYKLDWDASKFPSGIYFYTLRTADFIKTNKMILVK